MDVSKNHRAFMLQRRTRCLFIGRRAVDLNYLLYRQQVERSMAAAASSEAARKTHEEMARKYEQRIEQLTAEAFSIPSA
jgi:hypothetical protein